MLTHPIAFQGGGTMFLALAKTVTALALVKDVRREFPTVYGACTHNWDRMDEEALASNRKCTPLEKSKQFYTLYERFDKLMIGVRVTMELLACGSPHMHHPPTI